MAQIICGINAVMEAMRAGRRSVKKIFIAQGKKDSHIQRLLDEALRNKIKIEFVTKGQIEHLARVEKHQGVAAETEDFKHITLEELIDLAKKDKNAPFIIVLDQVSDPHNLGSIIRTAYLMGAQGVVIPKDNSAQVTQVVIKASAGAAEYLPIAQVVNITTSINILKNNNIWVVGADGAGVKGIYQYDLTAPCAIVLGGEGKGLRRLVKEACDELLSIPMTGRGVGSYNVSVAGAIMMAEVVRQRLAKIMPHSPKST